MKKTFQNLLKIKSIVTILLVGVFVYCTITGTVAPEDLKMIVAMVITYFFSKGGGINGNSGSDSE